MEMMIIVYDTFSGILPGACIIKPRHSLNVDVAVSRDALEMYSEWFYRMWEGDNARKHGYVVPTYL